MTFSRPLWALTWALLVTAVFVVFGRDAGLDAWQGDWQGDWQGEDHTGEATDGPDWVCSGQIVCADRSLLGLYGKIPKQTVYNLFILK